MDLSTNYLGLSLKHPIVPSSSPLSQNLDGIRQLEDAGAAAVVLFSLFEEQISQTHASSQVAKLYRGMEGKAKADFPEEHRYPTDPEGYAELIREAKASTDIPIIASLNGATAGGWTHYARIIEEAGADALELNIYYLPSDPGTAGEEVEQIYFHTLQDVRETVKLPIAIKLNPHFTAPANIAQRLARAGADGLVLFNRFYQADIDLDTLSVAPYLKLSNSYELLMPLRWAAILYGRVAADLAITSGVHTAEDVIKVALVGGRVSMVASELLQSGPGRIAKLREGVAEWLEARGYDALDEIRGRLSYLKVEDPDAFTRANYLQTLQTRK